MFTKGEIAVVTAVVVVGGLGILAWFLIVQGKPSQSSETEQEVIQTIPTPIQNYQVGETLKLWEGSTNYCILGPQTRLTAPDYPNCDVFALIFDGDMVQITGPAECYKTGCFWPAVGLTHSPKLVDGTAGLVPDEARLYPGQDYPHEEPDYTVGEAVAMGFGYNVRTSPNGSYILGNLGLPIVAVGSYELTLTETPVLGDDGHYWCGFIDPDLASQQYELRADFTFWVPCEFSRVQEGD